MHHISSPISDLTPRFTNGIGFAISVRMSVFAQIGKTRIYLLGAVLASALLFPGCLLHITSESIKNIKVLSPVRGLVPGESYDAEITFNDVLEPNKDLLEPKKDHHYFAIQFSKNKTLIKTLYFDIYGKVELQEDSNELDRSITIEEAPLYGLEETNSPILLSGNLKLKRKILPLPLAEGNEIAGIALVATKLSRATGSLSIKQNNILLLTLDIDGKARLDGIFPPDIEPEKKR